MNITERTLNLNLNTCNAGKERLFVDIVTIFINANSATAPKLVEKLLSELEAGIKDSP